MFLLTGRAGCWSAVDDTRIVALAPAFECGVQAGGTSTNDQDRNSRQRMSMNFGDVLRLERRCDVFEETHC